MGLTVRAKFLKRFTHLPALLSLLQKRELTLLSPSNWEDRNDRVFMEEYARKLQFSTVLGLCFSQAVETFHHWKVFAPGPSGVCVEFHKSALLASVPKSGFKHRNVKYLTPTELLGDYQVPSELPFIKQRAYKDEKEYRIVFSSDIEKIEAKALPIQLAFVRAVTLSPWLPDALFDAAKNAINKVHGCADIPVVQSRIVENVAWQDHARNRV